MDLITHLLVCDNIQVYLGEFYLPTDCPVFLDMDRYGLRRADESIFAGIFEGFDMPSYSNYPYPYEFDNDEEQFKIATMIREKVETIKSKSPRDNFMYYEMDSNGLEIVVCRDGEELSQVFASREADIYLSAIERHQFTGEVAERLGMASGDVCSILDDFEQKGLILYSSDRKSFLSLATKYKIWGDVPILPGEDVCDH